MNSTILNGTIEEAIISSEVDLDGHTISKIQDNEIWLESPCGNELHLIRDAIEFLKDMGIHTIHCPNFLPQVRRLPHGYLKVSDYMGLTIECEKVLLRKRSEGLANLTVKSRICDVFVGSLDEEEMDWIGVKIDTQNLYVNDLWKSKFISRWVNNSLQWKTNHSGIITPLFEYPLYVDPWDTLKWRKNKSIPETLIGCDCNCNILTHYKGWRYIATKFRNLVEERDRIEDESGWKFGHPSPLAYDTILKNRRCNIDDLR